MNNNHVLYAIKIIGKSSTNLGTEKNKKNTLNFDRELPVKRTFLIAVEKIVSIFIQNLVKTSDQLSQYIL